MTTKPTVTREMIERVCRDAEENFEVGHQSSALECAAVRDLALHALTDSVARGALERVRADIYRLQPQFVGEHETVSGSAMGRSQTANDALRIIDRELAALPTTATVAQPAEPGLSIAETEDWMGRLCEDSKVRSEFPMQDAWDTMCASSFANIDWSESVEELLSWCVRTLGGARG